MTLLLLLTSTTPPAPGTVGTTTLGIRISDGITTVTLSDGITGYPMDYVPKTRLAYEDTVTEKITVLLLGGYESVRGNIELLNRLLQQAQDYQEDGSADRVFIERQLHTDEDWWRSEIVEGVVLLDPDAFDVLHKNGLMQIDIAFTRRNWWEGAEAQVPLSNGHGTDNTSGLTIYNQDYENVTGTIVYNNWVTIAEGIIEGDLPAPTRIEYTCTSAFTEPQDIWIGVNAYDPVNFVNIVDGSGGDAEFSAAPGGGGAGYSSTDLDDTTETLIVGAAYNGSGLTAFGGKFYKPFIRVWTDADATLRLKIKAGISETNIYSDTSEFQNFDIDSSDITMVEMPAFKMPPNLSNLADLLQVGIRLYGKTASPPVTVYFDYFQLVPLESWRRVYYENKLDSIVYKSLVDDGIDNRLYAIYADVYKDGSPFGYNHPITLVPNKLQRIYFMWLGAAAGGYSHDTRGQATIKLYYRPRRLSLN